MWTLQKGFQVMSEGETPIIKKNSVKIRFDEHFFNNSGEGFLPTTRLYKSANDTYILDPKKWNM